VKGKLGETLATGDQAEAWRNVHSEGKMRQKKAEEDINRRWGDQEGTDSGRRRSGDKTESGRRSK
jgi:hypothetical protein